MERLSAKNVRHYKGEGRGGDLEYTFRLLYTEGGRLSILVTGGAGYIGSHACLLLMEAGVSVVVLDNLSNSCRESLERVQRLAGQPLLFIEGDINDRPLLETLFRQHQISAVMHFAGLKAVGESVAEPERYYRNNVGGSETLMAAMEAAGVYDIIFSSSATVYGGSNIVPIDETACIQPTNPYGDNKAEIERMLMARAAPAGSRWRVSLLRYFNPVGAHTSGAIGEDPNGIPNNLLPYISKVAVGKLKELSVFGNDYPTTDGTGVRDYIHVMDLAQGHLAALRWLRRQAAPTCEVFNLGTGKGYSVLEVLQAFEQACGKKVPYQIVGRRSGDIATCYADASKAEKILDWKAKRSLDDMMRDAWNWQQKNPDGYHL